MYPMAIRNMLSTGLRLIMAMLIPQTGIIVLYPNGELEIPSVFSGFVFWKKYRNAKNAAIHMIMHTTAKI